jgi:hypothetical protein
MDAFILVFFFLLPNGEVRVAHEGIPPVRMTLQQCKDKMHDRMEAAQRQVPWVTAACVPVPNGDEVNDRPTRSPEHT